MSLAIMSFARKPKPPEMMAPKTDANVNTPMAPIWVPMKTKAFPSGDQCVAMSTVERPATQIVETAVNRASARPVGVLFTPEKGAAKIAVNTRIIAARDAGVPVIVVSTELDEVAALADRIAVMYRGSIVGIVPGDTPRDVLGLMMAGEIPAGVAA